MYEFLGTVYELTELKTPPDDLVARLRRGPSRHIRHREAGHGEATSSGSCDYDWPFPAVDRPDPRPQFIEASPKGTGS